MSRPRKVLSQISWPDKIFLPWLTTIQSSEEAYVDIYQVMAIMHKMANSNREMAKGIPGDQLLMLPKMRS